MRILFQGDSITDAGRNKSIAEPNIWLGGGYVSMIYETLKASHPNIEVLNRGVFGNKTTDMYARWREDTLNIEYDVLSILCGINDIGFERRMHIGNDAEKFEYVYDRMLYEAGKFNPNGKIVLISPFLFKVRHYDELWKYDIFDEWDLWCADIEEEGRIVKKLSQKYDALYIPAFDNFKELCLKNGWERYTVDGIHLSEEGNRLLARQWIDKVYERRLLC